jgi:hypothetical protein
MSDIKLFRMTGKQAEKIPGTAVALEKSLQTQMEQNLETLLGIHLLASEYSTGPKHGGRIDTLGLDENGNPVIIEYKRTTNENVINQGLFYLDWLLNHRAEFELMVIESHDPVGWISVAHPPSIHTGVGGCATLIHPTVKGSNEPVQTSRHPRRHLLFYGGYA